MKGQCMICQCEATDLEHLKLYIIGSEGCLACESCRMALTKVAQEMRLAATRAKKTGYKAARGM